MKVVKVSFQQNGSLLEFLEKNNAKFTERSQKIFKQLYEHYKVLDKQLVTYTSEIKLIVKQGSRCQEIFKIDSIGVLTALAFVAALGDPNIFKNGREASAWLG